MTPEVMIIVYGFVIVTVSVLGGMLPHLYQLSHVQMQVILSFVGGLMLGIGMLHLLPHGIVQSGSVDLTLRAALVGLLFMFFLIRTFHFHQHGPVAEAPEAAHSDCDHDHSHKHHHEHGDVHALAGPESPRGWRFTH